MNTHEAREAGRQLAGLLAGNQVENACQMLSPILAQRTPFRMLDVIGACIGQESAAAVNPFLEQVAEDRTMGGWIVIASVLRQQIPIDLPGALNRCCRYAILADIWYAADSFGERVPGPALVTGFAPAVEQISEWRNNPNRWVRRMVGVAVHYWAKQAKGDQNYLPRVNALLDMLQPMFTEREQDAVKGVGWGLKTLGRYYPDVMAAWLTGQVNRPHRALMLHKASKYLPSELRRQVADKLT